MHNRWIALVALVIVALLLSSSTSPSQGKLRSTAVDLEQDRKKVQLVFEKYLQSIKTADLKLASEVWLQSPDTCAVTPLARFDGWQNIRDGLYVNFLQKAFTERSLQPSNLAIHVSKDAAWAVFDWTFVARLANGQPYTAKGWESHVYRKTDQGWTIAHLHYSARRS